jgi:UDP-GlcNAc:undecaprenyl-phosphate GlcNAc-1-phosphate transferase
MRSIGQRIGHLDQPGERKIHTRPIPATGGIAMFIALAGCMAAGLAGVWLVPSIIERLLPAFAVHVPGVKQQTPMALGLLAAMLAMHITGVIDDRRNLGPYSKLIVQVIAAAGLAVFFDVRLLELLGPAASILATIFWIVTITNAFNFLDNMDGLSGGVAAICAAVLLACALLSGQWFVAAVLALLVGALLGFLVFNFPAAMIFQGDGGSLVVGFTIAVCSIRVTYFDPAHHIAAWWAVFTPLVVLAVPLYDITSVTLIRLSQGKSPFRGDTQHFSHRLVKKGLSRKWAVIVIWCCTLATGIGGVLLGRVAAWQAALVIAQTAAIVLVLALLERTAVAGGEAR